MRSEHLTGFNPERILMYSPVAYIFMRAFVFFSIVTTQIYVLDVVCRESAVRLWATHYMHKPRERASSCLLLGPRQTQDGRTHRPGNRFQGSGADVFCVCAYVRVGVCLSGCPVVLFVVAIVCAAKTRLSALWEPKLRLPECGAHHVCLSVSGCVRVCVCGLPGHRFMWWSLIWLCVRFYGAARE